MSKRYLVGAFVVLSLSAVLFAQNHIEEWSGAQGGYVIVQPAQTVTITAPGTYKFQAFDPNDVTGLGVIKQITVAEGVSGTVDLCILRNPDDGNDPNGPAYDPLNPWGALDVGMIGFTSATPPAGLTINLAEVRVAGRLGPDEFDPATRATTITGLCKVGSEDVPYGTVGVEKDVYLDDLPAGAAFKARRLGANLYLTGTGPHSGDISVDYFLAPYEIVVTGDSHGLIHFGECGCAAGMSGHVDLRGDAWLVSVHTTLTGVIDIAGDVLHEVVVSGDVAADGVIHVAGNLAQSAILSIGAELWGSVLIDKDALQYSDIHIGSVWIGGIYGSLIIGGAAAGHIYAEDGIATGGALEIRGGLAQDGSIYLAGHNLGTLSITGDFKGNTCGDIDIVGDVGGYLQTQRIRGRVWVYGSVLQDPSGAPRLEVVGDIGDLDPNDTDNAVLFVRGALDGGLHVTGSIGPSGHLILEGGIGLDNPGWVQVDGDVLGLLQIIRLINPNSEQPPIWIQGNVGSDLCTGDVSIGPYGELHGLVRIDGGIFGATLEGDSQVDIRVPIDGAGALQVGGDVAGTIACEGAVVAPPNPDIPRITIGGNVSGLVHAYDWFGGLLVIDQDVTAGGTLQFDAGTIGDATVRLNALGGAIKVFGESKAQVHVAAIDGVGQFWTDSELSGAVRVAGEVAPRNDPNVPAIAVGGDLTGEIHAGQLAGDVNVDGSVAEMGMVAIAGELAYGATLSVGGDSAGVVTIGENCGGAIQIGGSLNGEIHAGRLAGDVNVDGSVGEAGAIAIDGELAYGATLSIGADLAGAVTVGENCGGAIHVDGSLLGPIDVFGYLGDLHHTADFAGHIRVNGEFRRVTEDAPLRVWIHQAYPGSDPPGNGPSSYSTVDWDASGDRWNANAEIVIGDANDPGRHYSRNTPDQRLWETTLCIGDMSNNGVVGFSDINPFVAALADPSTYALLLPGLAGSMVYHGDATCDGTLGFADINPFIALVAAGKCGSCSGDNGMNQMNQMSEGTEEDAGAQDPEQLAAILAANVAPELYDDLLELVGDAASQEETEEGAAYWEAVYSALIQ